MAEVILPGTYITVRDEGLITAGRVASGNIGIVGTANKGPVDEVKILGSFTEARELFGDSDSWTESNPLTLIRALEQIYNNGGRTVYAVRTASGSKANAAFQTKDGGAANLTKLTAQSPGTWGNTLKISIGEADDPALVSEVLNGNATNLNRSHVLLNGGLNSITVQQTATGKTLRYDIVYNVAADDTKPQVSIATATGVLDFTALAGFAPIAADKIIARYQVPKANSKKVVISYQGKKETYTIADAPHLAEQVRARSAWVTAPQADATHAAWYNTLPVSTSDEMLFGTGLSGNDAGANGETAAASDYKTSLGKLENDIINIVTLAGQDAADAQMVAALLGHINTTTEIKRERIGIIGSDDSTDVATISGHILNSERLIFVAPGIKNGPGETLPGAYMAAAVTGLISSLPVQASPTNKVLNVPGLAAEFSSSQLEKLVQNRVLAVEKRSGFRIVKGITTATNSAWHQVTTRRIVDYAIYGVRSSCDPYIGKLNNERVRGAMKATIDAFLTRMVEQEALVSYELEVSATRAQEIAGEAIVSMTIRPTFSIDFIMVTIYLE